MKKNIFNTIIITVIIVFSLSGCLEPRHYQKENHRGKDQNERNKDHNDRGDHRLPPRN